MLDFYYQSEQPFSSFDVEKIARKIKCHPETVQTILEEFFDHDGDENCWHNKRADAEIEKYHLKSDSARKANQKRWDSGSDLKSDALQILTNNHKPITNNQEHIDRFSSFWKHYPRKVAKPNAMKAWAKLKPDDSLTEKIIAAIKRQKLSDRDIQFVPHPATWLNARRWEDEETPLTKTNVDVFAGRRVI
jgi:uncharacterized protein YdaU (DUF1376 family)